MSATAHKPMTLNAFLDWERTQELRYEFDGVAPVAMNGGSIAHSMIATNLVRALEDRLRGGPCRAFRGDVKIVANGRIRYPDAVVTCAKVDTDSDIVPEPVVVFEVLSASTSSVDHVTKNEEYRATPSIRRYVILEQTQIAATVFARVGDDWIGHLVTGDAVLAIPEIGVELPMSALYTGLNGAGLDGSA
jgi:Uma2 family endonuclease